MRHLLTLHVKSEPAVLPDRAIRRQYSQLSFIFVLVSQYRSHSVPLANSAHCPRWFLSMGSRGCIACRMGQGGFWCGEGVYPSSQARRMIELRSCLSSWPVWCLAITYLHGFWDNFVSSSCLCALWNTCFRWSLIQWYDVSEVCVCIIWHHF
jgi:hypothetical protein